jgi:hypothetical protein
MSIHAFESHRITYKIDDRQHEHIEYIIVNTLRQVANQVSIECVERICSYTCFLQWILTKPLIDLSLCSLVATSFMLFTDTNSKHRVSYHMLPCQLLTHVFHCVSCLVDTCSYDKSHIDSDRFIRILVANILQYYGTQTQEWFDWYTFSDTINVNHSNVSHVLFRLQQSINIVCCCCCCCCFLINICRHVYYHRKSLSNTYDKIRSNQSFLISTIGLLPSMRDYQCKQIFRRVFHLHEPCRGLIQCSLCHLSILELYHRVIMLVWQINMLTFDILIRKCGKSQWQDERERERKVTRTIINVLYVDQWQWRNVISFIDVLDCRQMSMLMMINQYDQFTR